MIEETDFDLPRHSSRPLCRETGPSNLSTEAAADRLSFWVLKR